MNLISDCVHRQSGEILYDGADILKLGRAFREKLGFMPQSQGMYEQMTAFGFLCAVLPKALGHSGFFSCAESGYDLGQRPAELVFLREACIANFGENFEQYAPNDTENALPLSIGGGLVIFRLLQFTAFFALCS